MSNNLIDTTTVNKISHSEEVIRFIDEIGFVRDIEDNVWYSRTYKYRVVPAKYCKQHIHLYYNNGGFNNPKTFNSITELKSFLKEDGFLKF